MNVFHTNQIGCTINRQANFLFCCRYIYLLVSNGNLTLLFCTVRINWQTRSRSQGTSRKMFGRIRFVVFLKTPGGELNCKIIRLDFEATQWILASRNTVSRKVVKNSQALGNVPNSADFVACHKIYTVFYGSGCFKFRVTFHNVFLVLMSILI